MTRYQATRGFFAEQFLLELGAPINNHTLDAILAWMEGEGTKARNNPLATTRTAVLATPFNSAGVKNYPTFTIGMRATLETIRLAAYRRLVAAIVKGSSAHAIAREIVASPWGTRHVPVALVIPAPELFAAKRLY